MNASRVFAALLTACLVMVASPTGAQAARTAQDFVRSAYSGNQFEISSGRLALQNSQDDKVKELAQQLIEDHKQVDDQLKAVVASANSGVAQPAATLDQEHQALLDQLEKASGDAFDIIYIKAQVFTHNDALSLFREYSRSGDNSALKSFAGQTIPMLEKHRREVEKLKDSF